MLEKIVYENRAGETGSNKDMHYGAATIVYNRIYRSYQLPGNTGEIPGVVGNYVEQRKAIEIIKKMDKIISESKKLFKR